MRHAVAAALVGITFATPVVAQAQNVQQLLQGLTNGNQNQDRALREAFQRGYQRGYDHGRQDEARSRSGRPDPDRRYPNGRDIPGNSPDYRNGDNGQGYGRPPGQNDTYGR